MKKVLIARDIQHLLEEGETFLTRADMQVFAAATNDEVLAIHRAERVDLIITRLEMPGMASEQLFSRIREDATLRMVSLIMACANTPEAIKASSRCRANAVLLEPLHPLLVVAKAQQLLSIAARETLRVLLSANVNGHISEEPFYCRTRNVSATGMLVETEKRLAEGARLSCQFYLPNAKKVQTTGKIVRIIAQNPGDEEYQYGVMFTDIPPETKQLLAEYVDYVSRRPQPGG